MRRLWMKGRKNSVPSRAGLADIDAWKQVNLYSMLQYPRGTHYEGPYASFLKFNIVRHCRESGDRLGQVLARAIFNSNALPS